MTLVDLQRPDTVRGAHPFATTDTDTADATAPRIGPLLALAGAEHAVPLVDGRTIAYANFDYAASAPALASVAARVTDFLGHYASVHRGAGHPSQVSTAAYESARTRIGGFVGARPEDVVQIMRNTTDALNLLARAVPGDVVHLDIEHHANQLPWRTHARGRTRVVVARPTLADTLAALESELTAAPAALLTVTGASNVTGEVLPLAALTDLAHRHGARIAVDGAQLVPHRTVDMSALDLDYLAFSGHKLYAPFGSGVLVGRRDWLEATAPHQPGGGAAHRVTLTDAGWAPVPARHEGGTPNAVGAIALAAACDALAGVPAPQRDGHEDALQEHLLAGLATVPGLTVLRQWPEVTDVVGLATFTLADHTATFVAQYLSAEHGIGARDGKFCAHPLVTRLTGGDNAVRVSLGVGSTSEEVDRLLVALRALVEHGPTWTYDADGLPSPDPRPMPDWI